MRVLTRTIWILSVVSLLSDVASEMLYPIMPLYLQSIGFSVVLIGVLEGFAEATAGLSKGYFGKLSDDTGRRLPFVRLGYLLSAISKSMMGLFVYPVWIFFARTADRMGKGVRTAARDAMLSDEATPATKGKVFGFHRSMDTFGAVIGPLLAILYLQFYPTDYKTLFLVAFIPGIVAILFTFLLKEKKAQQVPKGNYKTSLFSFIHYWKKGPAEYRKVVAGLLLFTLFNSADIFLLLQAKQAGLNDASVIGVYVFYNLIYALAAYPLGIIADKAGLKTIYIFGLVIFALVYFGMAAATHIYAFYGLFFLYGLYSAATEGISKAWITNISDKKDTATAIGTYTAFQSICAMVASSLAGLIWYYHSAGATFITTGTVALLLAVYFFRLKNNPAVPLAANRKKQ